MKCKGFKVFVYINDFILVNPKHKVREAFDTLYDLLKEQGLHMNEDKTFPLLDSSRVWVYILIYPTICLALIMTKCRQFTMSVQT